jgi:hypothetical protein
MKTLHVDLASRSYPIYIGTNLLEQPVLFEPPPQIQLHGFHCEQHNRCTAVCKNADEHPKPTG